MIEPEKTAGGADADRPARLTFQGQWMAVHGRCRVGRGAGNVEQDGAAAAAVNRSDVHADQDQDCVFRRH